MNKIKIALIASILISIGFTVYAKTINAPKIKAEMAIELARTYIEEKKIDISRHFIGSIEYLNLHNEYQKPYWRIEYILLASARGGQIIIFVYQDGKINHKFGR